VHITLHTDFNCVNLILLTALEINKPVLFRYNIKKKDCIEVDFRLTCCEDARLIRLACSTFRQ
jgi:hypothetical protein